MRLRARAWCAVFAFASWPATCLADDTPNQLPPDAPTPDEGDALGSNGRVWTFALRGGGGAGMLTRVNICFLSPCDGSETWAYLLASVDAVATFGRPRSHWRWQSWGTFAYGPSNTQNAGKLFVGRMQTEVNPSDSGGAIDVRAYARGRR